MTNRIFAMLLAFGGLLLGSDLQTAWSDEELEVRVSNALPTVANVADSISGDVTYFEVAGRPAFLIRPRESKAETPMPWVWYAPTIAGQPRPAHVWMFRQFLENGIAIAGIDVGESMGNPRGREQFDKFHQRLTKDYGLATRTALIPQSRGGLMLYNWAAEHPDKVACIAGIYTVCDMSSWPGLDRAAAAYAMKEEELAAQLPKHNPIDRLAPLAKARIPILHIHGDRDEPVPLERNAGELAKRYQELGGDVQLIVVPDRGHEEASEFFESQEFVDFVIQKSSSQTR